MISLRVSGNLSLCCLSLGLGLLQQKVSSQFYAKSCPNALCDFSYILPCALTDTPNLHTVKLFCARCNVRRHHIIIIILIIIILIIFIIIILIIFIILILLIIIILLRCDVSLCLSPFLAVSCSLSVFFCLFLLVSLYISCSVSCVYIIYNIYYILYIIYYIYMYL